MKLLAVLPAVLLLSACGATHYCMVKQDYQTAKIVPELQPADGLVLPESAGALRLPPPPASPVPFGAEDQKGRGVCLDQPPKMVPPAKPKEEPKPPTPPPATS